MKSRSFVCLCLLLAANSVLAASPQETAQSRGQLLHENHCIRCHTSSVYTREPRKITNLNDLSKSVGKWSKVAGLNWSQAEIHDVVDYLNREYYRLKN